QDELRAWRPVSTHYNFVRPLGRIKSELPSTPEFDWDEHNRRHIKRHRVEPEEGRADPRKSPLELEASYSEGEERFPAIGATNSGRWLVIVTAMRGSKARVVTAFDASKRLIEMYLKEKRPI